MKYFISFIAILFLASCGADKASSSSVPSVDRPLLQGKQDDGFIEGVWVDQWLLQTIKARKLDEASASMRNDTEFETTRDKQGNPQFFATVPDIGGELEFKDGKWYWGDEAKIEFLIKDGDTLALYNFHAPGYEEEGVGPIRTYEKVPQFSLGGLYQLYYFPGSYVVTDATGKSLSVNMSSTGEIRGIEPFVRYGFDFGYYPAQFLLWKTQDAADWPPKSYIIKETKSGFSFFEIANEKELDGYDSEVVQGALAYEFTRK